MYQDPLSQPELVKLYVLPHTNVSKSVEEKDIPRVFEDSIKMHALCHTPVGLFPSGFAIAHAQITADPLAFYVTFNGDVVINPVIVRHSNSEVFDLEGCMSAPNNMPIRKGRWYRVEMEYNELEEGEEGKLRISERKRCGLKGREARVALHEAEHLAGLFPFNAENSDIVIQPVIIPTEVDKTEIPDIINP